MHYRLKSWYPNCWQHSFADHREFKPEQCRRQRLRDNLIISCWASYTGYNWTRQEQALYYYYYYQVQDLDRIHFHCLLYLEMDFFLLLWWKIVTIEGVNFFFLRKKTIRDFFRRGGLWLEREKKMETGREFISPLSFSLTFFFLLSHFNT
jgi:hypothetical protein